MNKEYEYYRQELINSIRKKSKNVYINSLKLFDVWEISREEFENAKRSDKMRYTNLLKTKYQDWLPVIIDNDNFVIDGYHRIALAKFKLKKRKIGVINKNKLSKAEYQFILNNIIRDNKGYLIE